MYSQQLQSYIQEASQISGLPPEQIRILNDALATYLSAFSGAIGGKMFPPADLLTTSLKLISMSISLSEAETDKGLRGSHYLVAMGLEQSGELLSRSHAAQFTIYRPMENDYWYRLSLAFLHYMAGGFRVQALSGLRHLQRINDSIDNSDWDQEYKNAVGAFWTLFRGRTVKQPANNWENVLFGDSEPVDIQAKRIYHLAQQISSLRKIALSDLGQENEEKWLSSRGINEPTAIKFWETYLKNLERRGYTNFTEEQIGDGFDAWLRPDHDLLVILPTGSGKTVIGELQTALSVTKGGHTIWMTPMRALVRQVKKDFSKAFRDTGATVEELPTTEDLIPLFTDTFHQSRVIAVSTPEKLAALIRGNPDAVKGVRLLVLDEAQILLDISRGATVEYVLQEMQRIVPECTFILMSAFGDVTEKLLDFMTRLRKQTPTVLSSENRPTRRIYGVITNQIQGIIQTPIIQIYPPGIQTENSQPEKGPFLISIDKKLPNISGATDIAQSLVNLIALTKIRTVMFVGSPASGNSQAEKIAAALNSDYKTSIPDEDRSRLRVELGRESIIELTGIKRIAPHHAGLSKLEQHIVEKWTQDNIISTVVATPTLAQGVNLPFDLSILTYISRRNEESKGSEPVPLPEIMNMVGRAGRAGQVSDGMCLIALKTSMSSSPINTLNSARKFFFRKITTSQKYLGLARLLQSARKAKISEPDWIFELSETNLNEAQTLISFSLDATQDHDELRTGLLNRLMLYPSMQDLQSEYDDIINDLEVMINNIATVSDGDSDLKNAILRTGMPIEILRYFLVHLRNKEISYSDDDSLFTQADQIVRDALLLCKNRSWFIKIMGAKSFDETLEAISRWRNGEPFHSIEQNWRWKTAESSNRINIARFFNHEISQFAQFWGALGVCAELTIQDERIVKRLSQFQTFVREGVSSMLELEWLNKLGGLDRVLAHRLAELTDKSIIDEQNPGSYIERQLESWQSKESLIPVELADNQLLALVSILHEL